MIASNRMSPWPTIVLVALLAVAAAWRLRSEPPAKVGASASEARGAPAAAAPRGAEPGSVAPTRIAATPARGPSPVAPADPTARPVYTSRFAGAPGYYPPDDPESLSVVTGRREAPPVDLELSGGAASLRNLGQELLAALNARSEPALVALRVTKHEFRVICWPEFPESRPVTHITLDDAWLLAAAKSQSGGSRAIGLYGGRDWELLRVETDAPFAYRNFTRYSGVVLVVRDPASREQVRLRFAPSVIERHGRFKVLIYRDR